MVDLARPMLAEVLACVEGLTDPADAQECLVARGLLPEGWCGDVRRGWWCAVCSGRGAVTYQTEGGLEDDGCGVCAVDDPGATGGARLTGYTPHASTIPDLVAVASLGVPAILSAETLARESAAFDRPRSAPHLVVWRVGERETTFIAPDGCTHEQAVEAARRRDALVRMGLALDAIDRDAVRIVVPPVGGAVRPAEWGPQPSGVYGYDR